MSENDPSVTVAAYRRIIRAMRAGTGVKLSAGEVWNIAHDDAIESAVATDDLSTKEFQPHPPQQGGEDYMATKFEQIVAQLTASQSRCAELEREATRLRNILTAARRALAVIKQRASILTPAALSGLCSTAITNIDIDLSDGAKEKNR